MTSTAEQSGAAVVTSRPPADATPDAVEHPKVTVRRGMHTIWGSAQSASQLIAGVGTVSTASHGGIIISESRRLMLPEYMRHDDNSHSYEEDCAWSIIFVAFEAGLLASGDEHTVRCIREGHHTDTLRNWYPDIYEAHFGVTLQPGESFVKDERTFYAEHATDPIVVAAFGDWHARVPAGMVGVVTRVGGHGNGGGAEQYFLVPEGEYDARGRFGFVVEPMRHEEIEKFC
ncbi:MAG TPA: hypothetical protein VFS10_23270 [Pyrinomonadaceae bacterium]|nr:hypothetical protein [Pyrinomonadaceae bacterium]